MGIATGARVGITLFAAVAMLAGGLALRGARTATADRSTPRFLQFCSEAPVERPTRPYEDPAYLECLGGPGRIHIVFSPRPDGSLPWVLVLDQTNGTVARCIAEVSCRREWATAEPRSVGWVFSVP